jgi:predicted nucleotidyltransferase
MTMSASPPRPPDLPDPIPGTESRCAPIEFYGGYQVYSESGVDLTLLRENLKRTVTQLWENNCRALPRFEEVGRAGRKARGESSTKGTEFIMLEIEKILRLLSTHQVEFVVIGGLAMIAQGSAYITKDIDFCYSRSPKNIAALADACASIHPYLRGAPPGLPFRFDAPTIQAGLNFTLTTDLGDIDFLGEVSGLGAYEKVFGQSEEKAVYGLVVRVLSLDGLIAAKKAASRTKDKLHLLELEELKKLRDAAK